MGELIPYYLRDDDPNTTYTTWFDSVIVSRGIPAAFTTMLISVAAVGIAGFASLLFAPIAARNINRSSPFGVASSRAGSEPGSWLVRIFGRAVRLLFILAWAIPEYIYAFLLLAVYGPQTWPLVLALAIHNFGILGRADFRGARGFSGSAAGESSIGRAIENAGRVFGIVPWSIAQILCLLFLSLGNLYPRRNSLGNARGCFSRFFDQR